MLISKSAACCGCICLLCLVASRALAEPGDPLDPAAPTLPVVYQPALAGYPPLPERPLQNWPEANRVVGEIGGWRVYANEPWEPARPEAEPPLQQGGAEHVHH